MKPRTAVSCLLLFCILISGSGSGQAQQIGILPDDSPLSSDAIYAAFGVLGLAVEHFAYEAPFNHELHFELMEFRNADLQGTYNLGSFSGEAGKRSFVVYLHQTADGVKVSVEARRKRSGLDALPLNGMKGLTWATFENPSVNLSSKTPVLGLAADSNGVTGFDTSEPLESIARKYPLFVAITARIEKK